MNKILYVEDELVFRKSFEIGFKPYLTRTNSKLDVAVNLKSALEMIAQNDYDVVVSDGCLNPGGHDIDENYTGVEVVKAAKAKGIYTIGLSSQPERFDRLAGQYLDINYKKPYEINILEYLIDQKPNKEEFDKKFS